MLEMITNIMFSKTERDYLSGEYIPSITHRRVLNHRIRNKIKEHSPRFWNLIAKHMPKYQESVKWLEVNGIRIN